jgi:SAM-dependent methyltransferase
MNTPIPDNWYESFFTGINCEMWEKAASKEWTDLEVNFITDVLNIQAGSKILDMPCGTGRHSIELAKKGFQITAVDISEEFINNLKKKSDQEQLNIEIVHGNILTITLNGTFDGGFCLGNSFGYFPYEDMQIFVKKVSASLKKGGKWIINTGVVAEGFLSKFTPDKKYELDGLTMEIHNDYDIWESCLLTTLIYTKNEKQEIHRFKHYAYTVAEIIRMLGKYDLRTIAVYKSTDKTEFKLGDDQVYLVVEKY